MPRATRLTIVDMPSNSDSTGGATPTAASSRSTACRDGSPAGAASQGSCRSARRSTGWSSAAAGWVRGSTSTSWSLIRWYQVRIDPPSSISSARRLVQSSTMATSTSPERTWRRPSPASVCRSTRVSRGWVRRLRASAGANATAADGKAVATTRPAGSAASADRSVSASSTMARMRSAWPARRRPASVSSARRADRSSSAVPASRSSVASCWETADGV